MALVTLLTVSIAHAHPGHGPADVPPSHVLLSPDHLGALLIAGVILFSSAQALRWRKRSRSSTS